jgi:hypothetical protein
MRQARSKNRRPLLLAELERRYLDDYELFGGLLNNIHAAGSVASFGVFVGLSARDIWQLGNHQKDNCEE